MSRDFEYEKNNIGYDEQYPEEEGGGIKCKNYDVCKAILPMWWYECKECYICTNCDMSEWGVLEVVEDDECPMCLDTKKCIKQPWCGHVICTDCFRRCYYGDDDYGVPPIPFPYSKEIEDMYDEDCNPDDPRWDAYPLIREWIERCDLRDFYIEAKYAEEKYLRRCPICRKKKKGIYGSDFSDSDSETETKSNF